MACTLPTLDKTWEFHVNDVVGWPGNKINHRNDQLIAIKNALINVTDFTSPWVVESGCDSSTAVNNNPGTADLWIDNGDLTWHTDGNAHSWIVLKQPGVNSGGFQLCFDLSSASVWEGDRVRIMLSPSDGFGATNGGTDGTTTNRPTATDERQVLASGTSPSNWTTESGSSVILHVQMSDDGECTRLQLASDGDVHTFMIFDVAKDPLTGTPGWPEAIIGAVLYTAGGSGPSYARGNDSTNVKAMVDGNTISAYITSLGDGSAAFGQNQTVVNDLGSCWEMYECGIWAPDSETPAAGQLGKLYDLRWVSTALAVGDTFPQTGTLYQWMCIGDFAIPWNQINATYITSS